MENNTRPKRASGQPSRYKDFVAVETSDTSTAEEDKPTSKAKVPNINDRLQNLKDEVQNFDDDQINDIDLIMEESVSNTGYVPGGSVKIVAFEHQGVLCHIKKEKPSITVEKKTSESQKVPLKPCPDEKICSTKKTSVSPQEKNPSASNARIQGSAISKNYQDCGPNRGLQKNKSQKKSPTSTQFKPPRHENVAGKKENGIYKPSLPKPSFTKTVNNNNSNRQVNIGMKKASLSNQEISEDMNGSNMLSRSEPNRVITADVHNNNTDGINQNDTPPPEKPLTEELFQYLIEQLSTLKSSNKMDFRKVLKRLDNIEDIIARELSPEFPTKPDCLPLQSRQDLTAFENVSVETYRSVVTYLGSFSIGSLPDTARIIVKNGIADSLSPELTWQGGQPGTVALGQTRFAKALYAAAARNKTYEKPQWQAFSDAMYGALKASKQRYVNAQAKLKAPAIPQPIIQGRGRQGRRIQPQDFEADESNEA